MPYFRMNQNWQITVKTPHTFRLELREGIFNDTLRLYVDEELVFTGKAGMGGLKGTALFEVDGRTLELKWEWNLWTGNPTSIVIVHKDRILAGYGSDSAAWIGFEE